MMPFKGGEEFTSGGWRTSSASSDIVTSVVCLLSGRPRPDPGPIDMDFLGSGGGLAGELLL